MACKLTSDGQIAPLTKVDWIEHCYSIVDKFNRIYTGIATEMNCLKTSRSFDGLQQDFYHVVCEPSGFQVQMNQVPVSPYEFGKTVDHALL